MKCLSKIGAKALIFALIFGVSLFITTSFVQAEQPAYKNPQKSIDVRVKDLLNRMTLEEKAAQLQTIYKGRHKLETVAGVFIDDEAQEILGLGIGQVARPSENRDPISPNKTPLKTVEFTNALQKWLVENTRLGIPAIFHEEALHGYAGRNGTSFPQAIAMASIWDAKLIHDIYEVAAQEIRAVGAHQALTPILDVGRDPRWGRIEETMGEDPYLISELGVASIKGFQGDGFRIASNRVISTLKHLVGHGEPIGGLNIAPTPIGDRGLREIFLPPFEAAIKVGGARSVMASYNEIDGIPSHSNIELLQDILRDEWGFDGVIVSDYGAIDQLNSIHGLTETKAEAALLSLAAGVDLETPDGDTYKFLVQLIKDKKLSEKVLDRSVARILREKFLLGLFENPYTDPQGVEEFVGNDQHRQLAQLTAEKAMVLLKNEGNLLPLNAKNLKSIALIGPHVHETLLGGYSGVPKQTISILQGLQDYLGGDVKVNYEPGTILTVDSFEEISEHSKAANTLSKERWFTDSVILATKAETKGMLEKAVAAAKKSDVAVVVVGDNEATSREAWAESHLGDRASLNLLGEQQELVDAIIATGKPTIVILIGGRPLAINKIARTAPAIIEGWYLGQETGTAVARVLFGDVNPSGKLPVSFPRSVGHIPAYYNYKPSAKRGYAFDQTSALFAFGHGLSYTTFDYSDLKVNKTSIRAGEMIDVSVIVTNTGERGGEEVVQLYINDPIASVTQPVKLLKGFKRIALVPKESKKVTFSISANQLGFYDRNRSFTLEPGKINLMLGAASDDIRLTGEFNIQGKIKNISKNKVYLTPVDVTLPHLDGVLDGLNNN